MTLHRRATLSLLAGGLALPLLPAGMAQAAPTFPGAASATLDLYQGGKSIGQQTYTITGSQSAPTVRSVAAFSGRVLGFRVKYDLETNEQWQGGKLQALNSKGQLRGQRFAMSAEKKGTALSVSDEKGRTYFANSGILPTSYWMSNFIEQREVLDTQRGGLLRLNPKALGRGTFAGRDVRGWELGGDLPLTIYYDRSGTWSGMSFSVFGADFEYRRV